MKEELNRQETQLKRQVEAAKQQTMVFWNQKDIMDEQAKRSGEQLLMEVTQQIERTEEGVRKQTQDKVNEQMAKMFSIMMDSDVKVPTAEEEGFRLPQLP